MIYKGILFFQILCIIVLAGSIYLCLARQTIRGRIWRDMLLMTQVSGLILTVSYGVFLQATQMSGLKAAHSLFEISAMLFCLFLIMTQMSLYREQANKLQHIFTCVLWIIGFACMAFLFLEDFGDFVSTGQSFQQNQYFYYIEETPAALGQFMEGFKCGLCLAAVMIPWKNRRLTVVQRTLWALSGAAPIAAMLLSKLPQVRHYNLMSLAVTGAAVLMLIAAYMETEE